MKKIITLLFSGVISLCLFTAIVIAKPDKVDGENVPSGRIPQEIKDNKYPRTYFPGTERVGKNKIEFSPRTFAEDIISVLMI